MVAERSVSLRSFLVTKSGGIRSENVDMSSDKRCEKHRHLKSKVSKGRLILLGFSESGPKNIFTRK